MNNTDPIFNTSSKSRKSKFDKKILNEWEDVKYWESRRPIQGGFYA